MAAKRSVVPKRLTISTGASTLNAPSSPPVQTHQGVPLNCAAVGHFERTMTWKSNRLAADTKADNIEAQRGAPPAYAAKFRLTAAWTTNEPPITKARKTRTKCIGWQLRRAKEFKQGSLADRVYFFQTIGNGRFGRSGGNSESLNCLRGGRAKTLAMDYVWGGQNGADRAGRDSWFFPFRCGGLGYPQF
jgi:hypothetical protein